MNTIDFHKIPIRSGYRILDIGCGDGRHLGEAIQQTGIAIIGVDRDLDDLLKARKRLIDLNRIGLARGAWEMNVADIVELPFPDQVFDCIICSEVLEHIPEEASAMAEIHRVLKPNGYLAVSVPRYLPEWICWRLSEEYRLTPKGHIRIYSQKRLLSLLMDAGFTVYTRHYAHSLHTPFWWLKCMIGLSRKDNRLINLYQRFLTWDIMQKPRVTRWLEQLLNPLLGKSIVLYMRKPC